MIWHKGALGGSGTVMAYLPRRQWGFAIVASSGEGDGPARDILSYKMLDNLRRPSTYVAKDGTLFFRAPSTAQHSTW